MGNAFTIRRLVLEMVCAILRAYRKEILYKTGFLAKK